MAIEDVEMAISFESYQEAYSYANAAAYFASFVYPNYDHPIQRSIGGYLAAIVERISQEEEAERGDQQEEDEVDQEMEDMF